MAYGRERFLCAREKEQLPNETHRDCPGYRLFFLFLNNIDIAEAVFIDKSRPNRELGARLHLQN